MLPVAHSINSWLYCQQSKTRQLLFLLLKDISEAHPFLLIFTRWKNEVITIQRAIKQYQERKKCMKHSLLLLFDKTAAEPIYERVLSKKQSIHCATSQVIMTTETTKLKYINLYIKEKQKEFLHSCKVSRIHNQPPPTTLSLFSSREFHRYVKKALIESTKHLAFNNKC